MDLERVLSKDGIPHGYIFDQDEKEIKILIKKMEFSTFKIDTSESMIRIVDSNNKLILCGKTFEKFDKYDRCNTIYDDCEYILIKIYKGRPICWPIFIIEKCKYGADAKSLFMIGIYKDANNEFREALEYFLESEELGYTPAKSLLADLYMANITNYDIRKDVAKGVQYLLSIPIEERTAEITLILSAKLFELKEKQKSCDVLREYLDRVDKNDVEVRYLLARRLSPLGDNLGSAQEAVAHLINDEMNNHGKALQFLSLHYLYGLGVPVDRKKALFLDKKGCELDKSLKPKLANGEGRKFVIAGLITSVVVASCVFIYSIYNQGEDD